MLVLALIASLATAQNAVKAGDKISGTVKSQIEAPCLREIKPAL